MSRGEVQFHHSLVISVCSKNRHPYSQQTFSNSSTNSSRDAMMDIEEDSDSSARSAGSTSEVEVQGNSSTDDNSMETDRPTTIATPQDLKTLDIHTTSSLIGTENLDIS